MIAKANLETKRKALTERASKLAFEKIACFERIDAIGRELEQIALLGKVMDVTLADMAVDSAKIADMQAEIDAAVEYGHDQNSQLDACRKARGFDGDFTASKGNDEGESVMHPG